MTHKPFIKRSLLALSIAALSAPALVMASVATGTLDQPAYNQEQHEYRDDAGTQAPASGYDRSNTVDSPAGHTGGATSTTTMEPAGEGMGASGDTGTSGTGAGSGTTVIEDGPSGAGTGTDTLDSNRSGSGTTMDRDNSGSMGTGTMGTDDGMGTSTGTGTYGTGTGPGAMDRDSSFETDRNTPSSTDDALRDSRDNRNTTPDSSTGTME